MDKKTSEKGDLFLIKWHGWAEKDNTWEPTRHLKGCTAMLEAFRKTFSSKPSSMDDRVEPLRGSGKHFKSAEVVEDDFVTIRKDWNSNKNYGVRRSSVNLAPKNEFASRKYCIIKVIEQLNDFFFNF